MTATLCADHMLHAAAWCAGPQQRVPQPAGIGSKQQPAAPVHHHYHFHHDPAALGYSLTAVTNLSFEAQLPYGPQPAQPSHGTALQAAFPGQQQPVYHYHYYHHNPAALGSDPQIAANPASGMQQRYRPQLPY